MSKAYYPTKAEREINSAIETFERIRESEAYSQNQEYIKGLIDGLKIAKFIYNGHDLRALSLCMNLASVLYPFREKKEKADDTSLR